MSEQPIRNSHYALERSLSEQYGVDVIISDAMPTDQVWLMRRDTFTLDSPLSPIRLYETLEPRFEAVRIVQEGMAEIVAWLKAAGHDMPDAWVQQDEDRHRRRLKGLWYDGMYPVQVIDPGSFVKIVAL